MRAATLHSVPRHRKSAAASKIAGRARGSRMKIHEYQGKELLRKFGVPVPRGIVARTPEEAFNAARELGTDVVVVKAQIHAGGRGKGGGVKLAKSPEEARDIAGQMLGMQLV